MKKNGEVIELVKRKARKTEENFIWNFSGSQLTAVMLLILASTFLVQGMTKYLEWINKLGHAKIWFKIIIFALIFLTLSVIAIVTSTILSPLGIKRNLSVASYVLLIIGFLLFLTALIFLLLII